MIWCQAVGALFVGMLSELVYTSILGLLGGMAYGEHSAFIFGSVGTHAAGYPGCLPPHNTSSCSIAPARFHPVCTTQPATQLLKGVEAKPLF